MFQPLLIALFLSAALAFPNTNRAPQTGGGPPRVATPLGEIEGTILKSRLKKNIFAFRGIRYALAPVNELRFKPPEPVDKWDGVLNATVDGASCPQPGFEPTSEDCLFLNVYSTKLPKGPENPLRPVIVYIHAGGFYSLTSSSDWIGPQYLLDQDVVLVTINYRLGSLGFLSTGDKEAPGNNGLKDQVAALKWVKQNIPSFGGNPDSVTIAGYSAGGFSVSLHLLSPMSRGLFHRAVIMSGSIFGQLPIPTNQLDIAKKQARLVGCPDDSSANIIKCLRNKTADELGDSLKGFAEFGDDPVLIWKPVIEGEFGQERFLTAHPIQLVSNGQFAKVPILTGVTTDEFAHRAFTIVNNATLLELLDKEFDKYAPIAFLYERDTENSKVLSKALRTFYFGVKSLDASTLPGLAQLYADSLIGFGVNRGAKLLAEKNDQNVYYYKFNYKGRYSNFYLPDSNGTIPYGVVHNDDAMYLFYISKLFPAFKPEDPESQTIDKLTTMWANFAKTGNPIPELTERLDNIKWEPFTVKNQKYLDIGNKLQLYENLFEKRYAEWEKLFPVAKYTNKGKQMG